MTRRSARSLPRARWLLRNIGVALLLALLLAACGQDDSQPSGADGAGEGPGRAPQITTIEEGVLTVGSDIPYPPFEMKKGDGYTGFDIDLINEIARRLELETSIVDTDFRTIFTQVAGGRFDVAVSATTITPKREEQVNFSIPYYKSQQSLTVNTAETPDIKSIDELEPGDVVGVQDGTTGKDYAEETLAEGIEIRAFPEGPDAYNALEAGAVQAVLHDEPTALAEVADREGLELVQRIDTGESFGIAVDPANEPLLEGINDALMEMIQDGTYQEIYDRYSDLPPGGTVAQG